MSRSPLTYAGALALLGQNERPLLRRIDKLLGGLILGSAVFAGPAAWALIGPKNESMALTRTLLDRAKGRALNTSGHTRRELLGAAHTVLVISSLFDAAKDVLGASYEFLEISDVEKINLVDSGAPTSRRIADHLVSLQIPMPSVGEDFSGAFDDEVADVFRSIAASIIEFISGLAAGEQVLQPFELNSLTADMTNRARDLYKDAYLKFAAEVPEFAIWIAWRDQAATREELRMARASISEQLSLHSEAMSKLASLLSLTAPPGQELGRSHKDQLYLAAQAVLAKPLLRSSSEQARTSLTYPTVRQGFVTPHFRAARYSAESRPTQEVWWNEKERRTDLDEFLAAHLSTIESTERPLILLGHPGAGKSLLTEVVAARLPSTAFTVVRVPLRRVNPTRALHLQISDAMELVLKKRVEWGQFTEECHGTVRVVILDGFDELILATGVTQSAYLEEVARFQQDELEMGRPVAMIVTSRTLVVDRARIPIGCLLVKLDDFKQRPNCDLASCVE